MAEMFRSFTPDLEIRSAGKGGDGRTIEGIAVPFNRAQRIDSRLVEQFASGAFDHQFTAAHRIPFTRDHMSQGGSLIGKTLELRNDSAGLWGSWRVSKTAAGEETLELIRDGVLDMLSVGFKERQNRRLTDGTIERVTADLREVSVVLRGAYGEAALVSAVRHQDERPGLERARQILAGLPVLPVR